MLHQTQQLQNPFSFPCNPFSSPSKFSPSTLSSQVEKGMKCIVKSGSSTAKMVMDNEVCGVNNLSPPSWFLGEDLFVDDFFNFNNNNNISNNNNNDEFELLETVLETEQQQQLQPQQQQQQQQQPQVEQHGVEDKADNQNLFLSPPLDTAEEADLEWLSHFVEDSFCQCSTPLPPTYKPKNKPEPEPSGTEFPSIALGRSRRMKRGRTGGRVWSTSCYDSDSYSFSPPASPARKQHKKNNPPKKDTKPAGPGQRICSHCGTQRTPQWRQGPEGAKTLCNACGVRYKSGRLFPEYRPACSPTFSSELHSNSHRKVLEMRKDKGSS